jgi:hypothetical protein
MAARTSRQRYPFGIARLATRQELYIVQLEETEALTNRKTKVRKTAKAAVAVADRIQEISRPGL